MDPAEMSTDLKLLFAFIEVGGEALHQSDEVLIT